MDTTFHVFNSKYSINYIDATTLHSNKYNESTGFYFFHMFFSNIVHDVVFRLKNTNQDCSLQLRKTGLSFYSGQEVTLVTANDTIIAYIDKGSSEYRLLTTNISAELGKTISVFWIFVITFVLIIAGSFLVQKLNLNHFNPLIFLIVPILYWFGVRVLNYSIEKDIDRIIENTA